MCKRVLLATLLALLTGSAIAADESPLTPEAVIQTAASSMASGNLTAAADALTTLDAQSVPAELRARSDLLLGIILLRQARSAEAGVRLESATAHPLLADYALYNLAVAQRRAGQHGLAAEALRRLTDQHPQSLFLDRARREMPRDYLEAGQFTQAEESARAYLAAVPSNAGRAEVRVTLGETLLRAGRTDEAEEGLRRVWLELPSSPESQRAKDLLATIPTVRPFTPDEQLQRAVTLYQLGRYGPAIPELIPFAAAGSAREMQVRLMLGISAFNVRQYSQAVQWLEPLTGSAGPDRAEALFWLGRSAGRAGDSAKFTVSLTRLADAVPRSRRSEESLYLLAQAAADDADIAASRAYLTRLIQEYPKGTWKDVALWLLGWLAYKQQEYRSAVAAWDQLVAEELGSRWRVPALFWRGRALEAAKRRTEAIQAYRTLLDATPDQYYYRLRANERLAGLTKKPVVQATPPASQALPTGTVNGLHARKARALRNLGLLDEATEEWTEHVRLRPEERTGLAEACDAFLDLGRYDKAVWVGTRVLRPLLVQDGGKPPIPGFWQCAYPLGHVEAVRQYATPRGLDPYLVLALIREESAFAPQAVSRTGARGLMQLMPQTADLTVREHRLGLGPVSPGALETPAVNIQIGTNHLADLLQDFGGNLILTVASYNAGKQPVQRWMQRFGFADEVEFVEDIPFTETRNYVKRVLGSYERYKVLYGTPRTEKREPRAATSARRTQ
jgi:soluble lytic murein transglycosylase